MGFLSHLKDVVTGRVAQCNRLVTDHLLVLHERLDSSSLPPPLKKVALVCLFGSAQMVARVLLYDYGEGIFPPELQALLRRTARTIAPKCSFEIYKLVGCHYLMVFLKTPSNAELLAAFGEQEGEFKNTILGMLDCTAQDREWFEEQWALFPGEAGVHYAQLWKRLSSKLFGKPTDSLAIDAMHFTQVLVSAYQICSDSMRKEMEDGEIRWEQ